MPVREEEARVVGRGHGGHNHLMFEEIAREIKAAKAKREKTVMIHFQVLVNADRLEGVSAQEFCNKVGIEHLGGRVRQDDEPRSNAEGERRIYRNAFSPTAAVSR